MEKFKINLQLFAESNVQTTLLNATGNDLSPEMKTFYSKDLIEMLGANLVHLQFGDPVSLPKHGGKTIEWRKWSKFKKALKPLTEGVTPDGTPVDVGTVTARINQFGDYSTVSDLLEMTAIDNTIVEITAKHSENAQVTIDTVVRNKLCCGTNVLYADIVTEDGTVTKVSSRGQLTKECKLTPDMIARAVATLKKANAPKINGSYVAIIHPSVSYDLQRNPEFIDISKYANATAIFNGEIGKLYGVRFVESTEAAIFTGTNVIEESEGVSAVASFKVVSAKGNVITIDKTLNAAQAEALAGKVVVLTTAAGGKTYIENVVVRDADGSTLTLDVAPAVDPTSESTITAYGGGQGGKAVYACLFLGKGAYKVVKLDADYIEVIVKGRGSAGTADPLSQRSTIGWIARGFGAEIAIPEYIVRVECGSYFSDEDQAN
jgi:N4-gp56 family major capsid protein